MGMFNPTGGGGTWGADCDVGSIRTKMFDLTGLMDILGPKSPGEIWALGPGCGFLVVMTPGELGP